MDKLNIKECTERELYLQVYNTENLWKIRHEAKLFEALKERFEYTEEQLCILKECLEGESVK